MAEFDNPDIDLPFDDLARFEARVRTLNTTAGDFSRVLARGLKSAVSDGKTLDQVLRRAALSFSSSIVSRALGPVEKLLTNTLTDAFSGTTTAFAKGGAVRAFASGGVVSTPSYFPMSGGDLGLAGEAGPEAILPLARGADGRLGVRGGDGARPVAITFNVSTPDAESFRRSELQLSKMVARVARRGQRGL